MDPRDQNGLYNPAHVSDLINEDKKDEELVDVVVELPEKERTVHTQDERYRIPWYPLITNIAAVRQVLERHDRLRPNFGFYHEDGRELTDSDIVESAVLGSAITYKETPAVEFELIIRDLDHAWKEKVTDRDTVIQLRESVLQYLKDGGRLPHDADLSVVKLSAMSDQALGGGAGAHETPLEVFGLDSAPPEESTNPLHYYNFRHDWPREMTMRIMVVIEDHDCDVTVDVTDVYPFDVVEDVLRKYCAQTQRTFHPVGRGDSQLSLTHKGASLDPNTPLYEYNVDNASVLYYSSGTYTARVFDNDGITDARMRENHVDIAIADHNLGNYLRQQYSIKGPLPLHAEHDQILFEGQQIQDDTPMFRLGAFDGMQIQIERQHYQRPVQYLCGQCGADVTLKRTDEVYCRQCHFRIVYKKPNPAKPRQFNCR